jgi:TetR/AcrR family transcriptional regulator, tetracycline repressor protein
VARPRKAVIAIEGTALTRQRIVAAAATILAREGYDALTMRALARELGVQAASLYWHVKDKEQLEDWLFDALLSDIVLAVDGLDWRDDLRAIARQMRHQLMRKRDMQRISAGRFVLGSNLLRHMEIILGALRRAGLGGQDAAYAVYALLTYVNGFVLFQKSPLSAAQAKGTSRQNIFAQLRRQISALPSATYPHTVALAEALTTDDPDARFDFGIDRLIDGLSLLAHTPTGQDS